MNFLSLNIRGVGVVGKASWVKGMVENFGVDFLAIQESMLTDDSRFDFGRLWGRDDLRLMLLRRRVDRGGWQICGTPKNSRKYYLWRIGILF